MTDWRDTVLAMDLGPYCYSATVTVTASPEAVYDLVADVSRMGEWSPVCTGCQWQDEARTRFVGTNELGGRTWQTVCRVEVATRGREFTFINTGMDGSADLVKWSYTIALADGGCALTESWELLPGYPEYRLKGQPDLDLTSALGQGLDNARAGITQTLANLKAAAES